MTAPPRPGSGPGPVRLGSDAVVVLDVDDTLVLERDYVRSGFAAVGRHLAVTRGWGGIAAELWRGFEAGVRGDAFDRALAGRGHDPDPGLVEELVAVYRTHRPDLGLCPDAARFLARLGGRPLAVITDGPVSSQRAKVDALGLGDGTALVVATGELGPGRSKPHPAAYERVERLLGANPGRCWYVGDHPGKDFVVPLERGWQAIRIRRPGSLHQASPTPPGVAEVASLDEVTVETTGPYPSPGVAPLRPEPRPAPGGDGSPRQGSAGEAPGARPRILLSPPDVGEAERDAVLRAFDGGWIAPLGPEVDAFEAELATRVGAPACLAVVSGSAALELALRVVGVAPGDEVVVATATFAASAFAAAHVGAAPVLCDAEPTTWGLDPELLAGFLEQRAATGGRPAAVLAVDLYGVCPRYDELRAVCDRYGIPLLEDAAEGLGSVSGGRPAGTLADLGVFSFNGNKIITTSGGGALVGPADLIDRARFLATQARAPLPHFEHPEIGWNYRLSNLLAAVGRAQLGGLDGRIDRRRRIGARYRAAFPDLDWLPDGVTERPNGWLSVALLPPGVDPAMVCRRLGRDGIEARRVFKPMHRQPVFASALRLGGSVADRLFLRGLCLPTGSDLTPVDQNRVIERLQRVLTEEVVR
ncbi:MAG: DegT/DnrJ/EryC1/StrS family aminotransferase [Acidimicrobiales bacterium]